MLRAYGRLIISVIQVHFSVGDTYENKVRSSDSTEHNTTLNMKSWRYVGCLGLLKSFYRNMKTIEHPPIIDFYRNSVDLESGVVRPSMAQLIHGEKQVPEEIAAIEDFKVGFKSVLL